MPEQKDSNGAGCDELFGQELNVSFPLSGVCRLRSEKQHYYDSVKLPSAPHWNRFTSNSTRPVGPAHRFLPNTVAIFCEMMKKYDVKESESRSNPGLKRYAWLELLLYSGIFALYHCNNMQAKDL